MGPHDSTSLQADKKKGVVYRGCVDGYVDTPCDRVEIVTDVPLVADVSILTDDNNECDKIYMAIPEKGIYRADCNGSHVEEIISPELGSNAMTVFVHQSNDLVYWRCARTEPSLLSAPNEERLNLSFNISAHIERSDAFWAIKLMRRERKTRSADRARVTAHLPDRLRAVNMKERIIFFAECADFFDGLTDPELVVDLHETDHGGL